MSTATPINETLFYTTQEAVRVTGITRSSLYVALKDGTLRAVKHGKRTMIRRTDLLLFMDSLPAWTPANQRADSRPQSAQRPAH